MRFFRRLLCSAALLTAATLSASAQTNYTTTMTLNTLRGTGGAVASAKVCATAVDAYGNPLAFSAPTWGLVQPGTQFCGTVNSGSISGGFTMPDACHTNQPAPIFYNVTIQQLSGGVPIGSALALNGPPMPNVCGTTYSLDSYTPSTTVVSPASQIVTTGSSVPSSCSSPSILLATVSTVTTGYVCSGGVYVAFGQAGAVAIAGDLGGTAASPLVTGIQGKPVASTAPTTGQTLIFNGTTYAPGTPPSSGLAASSSTLYSANAEVQVDSLLASAANGYNAFGDSQTVGYGASSGYPGIVAADIGATVNNYGYIGDSAGDVVNKIFYYDNPGDSGNPIKTGNVGTNDMLYYGTGGIPTVAKFLYAGATWEAASSTNKVLTGSSQCTQSGTWSVNSQYAYANGLTSSTAGNTLVCTVVVGPTGVFYLDYLMYTTNGTFTVKDGTTLLADTIGGSSTVSTSYAGAPPVNSGQPAPHGIYSVGAARYITTPGTRTITITVASGSVTPLVFVFPPVSRYRGLSAPRYNFMNLSAEGGLANDSTIQAYNAAFATWQNQMVGDGFNVPLLDTYNAVDSNLDFAASATQNCPAAAHPPVHGNQCWQQHVAQLVERVIGADGPVAPVTGDAVTGNTYGRLAVANTANPLQTLHSIWSPNRDNNYSGAGMNAGVRYFDVGVTGDSHESVIGYGHDPSGNSATVVAYGTADNLVIMQCPSLFSTASTCTVVAEWNASGNLNHPGSAAFGKTVTGAGGFSVGNYTGQPILAFNNGTAPFGMVVNSGAPSLDLFSYAATGETLRLGFASYVSGVLTWQQSALSCVYSGACTSTAAWNFGSAKETVYTVSTLPSASSLPAGTHVTVSDATTYTPGTCTGGGSDYMIAVTNGSSWSCH